MKRALGLSVHTGWAAAVVVAGTPAKPVVLLRERIQILGDDERFLYHMAADMKPSAAAPWIATKRVKALRQAKAALERILTEEVVACAIVAKTGDPGELDAILAAHPRIHTAEGCFYRDVLQAASKVPVRIVPPKTLEVSKMDALLGKVGRPWGKDQKLAALAAWHVLTDAA